VRFRARRCICFVCVVLSTALGHGQRTSLIPVVDNATQFDGKFRARANGVEEAFLERLFPSSHAANLLKLQSGDLLCFWFSGTQEGESNVAIVMSRLVKGSEQWAKTVEIDHQSGKSFQNPVAFQTADGRIWLLHTSQPPKQGQAKAEVLYLMSDDGGQTWASPRPLFKQPGSFIRQPPVLISNKAWLLPMYYTPGHSITNGAESDYSAVKITSDGGKRWRECKVPGSNGLVQQSIIKLGTGRFLGFFRSRYADFIYKSTSEDGCNWTVPTPSHMPNNNSSIQSTILRDGSLIIAFNNSSAGTTRNKTGASVRSPLSIALSQNGGDTWPWIRDIETGSSERRSESQGDGGMEEEYSYPSLLQDSDGKIDVAYTYNRVAIKIVRFDEGWVKKGNTESVFRREPR
jgi:predicted neuraminidase